MPTKCDYLRVYYSDFLSQQPIEDAERPTYADTQGGSIESEELQKWVLDSHPRSRTETYPLYLLTKDILRRVATDKCAVINTTLTKLRAELAALREAKAQGLCMYVCVCACMYVCMYVCIYICIYIYIHMRMCTCIHT